MIIRVKTYRQRDYPRSTKGTKTKHQQVALVFELWFLFILIYKSRKYRSDNL